MLTNIPLDSPLNGAFDFLFSRYLSQQDTEKSEEYCVNTYSENGGFKEHGVVYCTIITKSCGSKGFVGNFVTI